MGFKAGNSIFHCATPCKGVRIGEAITEMLANCTMVPVP